MTPAAASTVLVDGGHVQGHPSPFDGSVTRYLGIPYAAPPTGENRFRPPQPVVPWEGTLVCDHFGPVCPQAMPDPKWGPAALAGQPQSEDCLYLNVYQARVDVRPLPVFVWLHGGGFREGAGSDPNFEATGLAKHGVIVVVPNYRLHMFGFFAHPDLSKESSSGTSGMYGMLDAIQALHWVRDNIASFGGDPERVTVGGQSGGSAMTQTVLLSPLTKGLVHKVIIQSGPRYAREPTLAAAAPSYRTMEAAEQEGIDLLAELGLSSVEELRKWNDSDKIIEVGPRRDSKVWGGPPAWRLIRDGWIIPKRYGEIFEQNLHHDIPILAGHNEDEAGIYNEPRFTVQDLHDSVTQRLGPDQSHSRGSQELVDRWYQLYPVEDDKPGGGPLRSWNKSVRDHTRVSIALWAESIASNGKHKAPVFAYYFSHAPPRWFGWEPDFTAHKTPGYTLNKGPVTGAFHGSEFPYTFNSVISNTDRPWTEADRAMGERMSGIWAEFIKTGRPGQVGKEDWRAMNTGGKLQRLGGDWCHVELASPEAVDFWKGYLNAQPYF